MKKFTALLLLILIVFSLTACASDTKSNTNEFVEIYKQKVTEFIESGDIDSAIKALEEGVTNTNADELKKMLEELKNSKSTSSTDEKTATSKDQKVNSTSSKVEKFDISKYKGEWATSGFSWQKGGFHLEIAVNGTLLDIACSSVSSTRVAEATVIGNTSMITNSVLTTGFGDSWNNQGIIKLKFEDKKIICTVSDVQYSDEGSGWSIKEGEYVLTKYEEPPKGEYDDIVGTYIDENELGCFLHIGYKDSTKKKGFVKVELVGELGSYEVPITNFEDGVISAVLMSSGSVPVCAVDMTKTNSGWINAAIYIEEVDYYEELTFKPAETGNGIPKNPYYVG